MPRPDLASVGLLALRAGAGLMLAFSHGWGKLAGFAGMAERFPDPLGVGSVASLALAVVGELFCPLLVVLGLATRAACVPPLINMLVAAFAIHAGDPWGKKEFALLYALPFLALILTGPGRLSIDAWLAPRLRARLGR